MNNFCDLCIFVVVVVRLCYHLVPFCYHCEINLSWIEHAQTTSTTWIAESNTRRVLTSISGVIRWWFPNFLEPISEGSHNFLLKSHHVVFLQLSLGNNMGHNHMSHLWFLLSFTPPAAGSQILVHCHFLSLLSFLNPHGHCLYTGPLRLILGPLLWSSVFPASSLGPLQSIKNNSSKCCTDQVLQSSLLFSSSSHYGETGI